MAGSLRARCTRDGDIALLLEQAKVAGRSLWLMALVESIVYVFRGGEELEVAWIKYIR